MKRIRFHSIRNIVYQISIVLSSGGISLLKSTHREDSRDESMNTISNILTFLSTGGLSLFRQRRKEK